MYGHSSRGEENFATRVEERKINEGRILLVLVGMRKVSVLRKYVTGLKVETELGVCVGGILAPVQK